MDLGEDGCGVGGKLGACFPFYFSGIFIEGEKRLFGATSINNYQIISRSDGEQAFSQRGLIPACSFSEHLPSRSIFRLWQKGNRGHVGIIGPDFSIEHGGSGAWSIAPFIVRCSEFPPPAL